MAYIDKEKAQIFLRTDCLKRYPASFASGLLVAADQLNKIPTADVVEVKHGEWVEDGEYQVCSECGEEHHWGEYRATYCEDCGAKMDGKKGRD